MINIQVSYFYEPAYFFYNDLHLLFLKLQKGIINLLYSLVLSILAYEKDMTQSTFCVQGKPVGITLLEKIKVPHQFT